MEHFRSTNSRVMLLCCESLCDDYVDGTGDGALQPADFLRTELLLSTHHLPIPYGSWNPCVKQK